MKKIFRALSIAIIAIMLAAPLNVIASGGWSVNVSNPPWTIVSVANVTGNGVYDGVVTVNGTSPTWSLDVLYKMQEPSEYIYTAKVPDTEGHYGDCLEGYSVVPGNEALCQKLVKEGYNDCTYNCPKDLVFTDSHEVVDVGGHYIYADKNVLDVAAHWGDCPNGYSIYTGDSTKCRKDTGQHNIINRPWVDATYKCPEGYSNNPGHDNCRLWVDPTYKTETFTVTFDYNKWDQDPTKCHRPTAQSLDIPSWAQADFNKDFDEWKDAEECCTWVPPVYYTVDRPWVNTTYKCPEGYEVDPENADQCRKPVEGEWVYMTLNFSGKVPYQNPPIPVCAKCGSHVDELAKSPDDLMISFYSRGECKVCTTNGNWGTTTDELWVYMRSTHQFYIESSAGTERLEAAGVVYHHVVDDRGFQHNYIDATSWIGDDGVTYWIIDVPIAIAKDSCKDAKCDLLPGTGDNLIPYDISGKLYADVWGWKSILRSVYESCSRSVGSWDITADNVATRTFGGPTSWEWQDLAIGRGCSFDDAHQFELNLWNPENNGKYPLPACAILK
jgi:hypothetical protein